MSEPPNIQHLFAGTEVSRDEDGASLREHVFVLKVLSGPDKGIEIGVAQRTVTVGTLPTSDLKLTDGRISRRHCEIERVEDSYKIRDLGSTNGTDVDGVRVVEAALAPGALIRVGGTEIIFRPKKRWVRVPPSESDNFHGLVGASRPMRDIFGLLERIAPSDLTVLLVGETGTGKEIAARALHTGSRRASGPFVVVDCGAVAPTLVESELFGHERGAFTGAEAPRTGAFCYANGGTVFLDEIGELPAELQPKLLRALDRREVKPLGGSKAINIDVRVIAATNRDLSREVERGAFRRDLYFRLAEVVVGLPSLRERLEDMGLLCDTLLTQIAPELRQPVPRDWVAILKEYEWPGNVRELRNYLRRAAIEIEAGNTSLDSMPPMAARAIPGGSRPGEIDLSVPLVEARKQWTAPYEKAYLTKLLTQAEHDLDEAARLGGMHRKSLERLLRHAGLWPVKKGRS
ncbi:MAG: sigma 54-interacting transcriptional regulator [Deltaproteobacteria bacterium]|nr:sigma 54-interacting transcriptional regulator [Deltaproteobacteria bacterium]